MALPEPTTRSPGHLFLTYSATWGDLHTLSVRFRDGVDITDLAGRLADAIDLATVLSHCVSNDWAFTGWGIKNNAGITLHSELFDATIPGDHTNDDTREWRSFTITFTGRGNPGDVGLAAGQTRMVLHTGRSILVAAADKTFDITADTAYVDVATFLTDPGGNVWADFYGSRASVNAQAPVQFNAHSQRQLGN